MDKENEQPCVTDAMLIYRLAELFGVRCKIVNDFTTDDKTLRMLIRDLVDVSREQDELISNHTQESDMGSGGTEVPFNGGRPQGWKPDEQTLVLELGREVAALSNQVLDSIERMREIKAEHPSLRVSHPRQVGPILNAYREGDVSYADAVRILNEMIRDGKQSED